MTSCIPHSAWRRCLVSAGGRRPWKLLAALTMTGGWAGDSLSADVLPMFNRDIRPLLSNSCFQCHGPDEKKREGGLRLDVREAALAVPKKGRAAIVPGFPDQSELMRRVVSHDLDEVMPPPHAKRPALSERDIATLRAWIAAGAEYEGHWALQPVTRPTPPTVNNKAWVRNDIDRFILARLEERAIAPAPETDQATLARRVAFDLTGLPAGPAGNAEALTDDAAYRKRVDDLLTSPHYGERWGRHWLDQARYADSNGYAIDGDRVMWPYRDWVIGALNRDQPFDRFTIEQLAGDLLPQSTKGQRAATAFHRNTLINEEGGTDPEQFRIESVNDRVSTTGAVWLGLTIGCAQCHTHKYDPITQRDYYRLFAFFNSGVDRNDTGPTVPVRRGEFLGTSREAGHGEDKPAELMVMAELAAPRSTQVLLRGDFTRPDATAGLLRPGIPIVFGGPLAHDRTPVPPTRLDLARWLVSDENPLTARVTVNRVWMRYFGRGLVETEEDFGTQGTAPSHPDLLDWLATEFIRGGWSMKSLHRLIVTSATYRQSSNERPDLGEVDPRNLLLARQTRLRLEAEIIRDAALAASGLLERTVGGPSVRPPQPDGVYAFTQQAKKWETSTGPDRYRRGLYTFFYRSAPHPHFGTFDAPDFQTTCTRRGRSNTPLQSLALANDPVFLECAQALGERVVREIPSAPAAPLDTRVLDRRVRRAFQLALQREPTDVEADLLRGHAERQVVRFAASTDPSLDQATRDLAHSAMHAFGNHPETAALASVARVLFNLDAFITRE